MNRNLVGDRTIRDFGDQWSYDGDNEGYYGSVELLADLLGPLVPVEDLAGIRAADIGSGTGRIVRMLLDAGAAHVIAIEPSKGVELLRRNLAEFADRVEIIHDTGDALPAGENLDFVFSIGVVQFIPDPLPVLRAAWNAVRPGGRLVLWVYSSEGNSSYLVFAGALRSLTKRLPHFALAALCSVLNALLDLYILACRLAPLPLHEYVRTTLAKFPRSKRKLVIYDQLNPSYVKWYTRAEIENLVRQAGFEEPQLYHRHGYSWTVLAEKPA